MRRLLRDEQVLETALSGAAAGLEPTAICITPTGDIRIIAASCGWALPALAGHHGAETVYRVEQRAGQVRVEGWSRGESCILVREIPTLRLLVL